MLAVVALDQSGRSSLQVERRDPTQRMGDFFGTTDSDALPDFERAHVIAHPLFILRDSAAN